ncbi:MAG: hypothetical protein ACTSVU_05515 [Promethearchaeota archaeon]
MPIDFDSICTELFNKGIIIAAVVCRLNGEIVYISSNWSVEPNDLSQCIKKWQSHGQFTKLQDRKYSLLMNTQEYFTGINYKDKDFIIGAASLDENDRYYIIAYAPTGSSGMNAYVDVVRAANQMKESTETYMEEDAQMGNKYDAQEEAHQNFGDSAVKQEIDGFLQWIKDPNGISAYIQYYLDKNDATVISKIAKAYADFRNVFGF